MPSAGIPDDGNRLYRSLEEELVPLSLEAEEPRAVAQPNRFPLASGPKSAAEPQGAVLHRLRPLASLSGFPVIGLDGRRRDERPAAGSARAEPPRLRPAAPGECPGCLEAAASRAFDPGQVARRGAPLPEGMLFLSGECAGGWIYGLRNFGHAALRLALTSDGGEVWDVPRLGPGETAYLRATKPIGAMNAGLDAALP